MYYLENESTTCDKIGCTKKTAVRLLHRSVSLGIDYSQIVLIGRYCATHGKQELKKRQAPTSSGPQILNPKFGP
jgi:hypothetical protein